MSGFGLDLGNRFSTVAITRRGNADVCLNETSQRETPTVVSFGAGDAERFIGEKGNDQFTRNVTNTYPNLKRMLGVKWGSALHEHEKKYIFYKTREAKDGFIEIQGTIRNEQRWFPVEQLLAMLFVHMRGIAETEATVRVVDSVVAVPAYWTPSQRRRLAAAAAVADYHLLNIISETTAAAVMYGWPRTSVLPHTEASAERILIFDLGHSCTTVSVAAFWRDGLRTLFHVCDPYVGVRDMIHEVVEKFAVDAKTKFKYDVKANPRDLVRFITSAERASRVLSANLDTLLNCELPEADLSFPFSRDTFETIIAPQLQRIETIVSDAMKAAGTVSNVEIIGGGSRIPAVKALIERVTGMVPRTTLNASEAVARGAAMDGAFRSPKFSLAEGSFSIWDASSHPLCVMYVSEKGNTTLPELPEMNKRVSLLPLHEKLPKCLTLTFDRKESFDLAVVHDPSDLVAQVGSARVLGTWRVELPKIDAKGKKGPPVRVMVQVCPNGSISVNSATVDEEYEEEVEETVEVGGDGEMPVDGEEKKTEKRMVMKTQVRSHRCPVTQLSSLEVPQKVMNEWREEERQLSLHDSRIKEEAEVRNELEALCFDIKAQIAEGGELREFMPSSAVPALDKIADRTLSDLEDSNWEPGIDGYKTRKGEIQQLLKPHRDRSAAYSNVFATESDLTAKANTVRGKLAESKFDHLSADDKATISNAVDELAGWGASTFATLKSQSKETDPSVTASDVRAKMKELDTKVNPIFAKPVPKADAGGADGDADMKPAA